MCSDDAPPIRRYVTMLLSGTASATAKASPGLIVSGLSICGVSLENWITIATFVYIVLMGMGAIPKAVDGLRYLLTLKIFERKNKE